MVRAATGPPELIMIEVMSVARRSAATRVAVSSWKLKRYNVITRRAANSRNIIAKSTRKKSRTMRITNERSKRPKVNIFVVRLGETVGVNKRIARPETAKLLFPAWKQGIFGTRAKYLRVTCRLADQAPGCQSLLRK